MRVPLASSRASRKLGDMSLSASCAFMPSPMAAPSSRSSGAASNILTSHCGWLVVRVCARHRLAIPPPDIAILRGAIWNTEIIQLWKDCEGGRSKDLRQEPLSELLLITQLILRKMSDTNVPRSTRSASLRRSNWRQRGKPYLDATILHAAAQLNPSGPPNPPTVGTYQKTNCRSCSRNVNGGGPCGSWPNLPQHLQQTRTSHRPC